MGRWHRGLGAVGCLVAVGCSGPQATTDAPTFGDGDPTPESSAPGATADTATPGTSAARQALLDALGDSVWLGTGTRDGVTRTIEQHFQAGQLQWAEIINPWGPGRYRQLRDFDVDADGVTAHTTVVVPPTWPEDPAEGSQDDWTLTVSDGSPRQLEISRGGTTETYQEGSEPEPTSGMTAYARVWTPNDAVDLAFCDSGVFGFDYLELFRFARGVGLPPLAEDVVAGAPLAEWRDQGDNDFRVSDVPGFEVRGGTLLDDRFNYVVTYRGAFVHPGGTLSIREADDSVEDGIWVFLGDEAGAGGEDEYFLEVHGFLWSDGTSDEPSMSLQSGTYEIEVMIARCTEPIRPVLLQASINGSSWAPVDDLVLVPRLDQAAFPSPF